MDGTTTTVLAAVIMVAGLVGTIVPILPGLGLVWFGALFYGLGAGFGPLGVVAFVAISALAVGGTVAGIAVPHHAAGAAGASRPSLALGVAAAVVGFFVVPIVGFPLGGVLGIFVGEQVRTRDGRAALAATRATLVGFGLAALLQVAAGLLMIGCWLGWLIAG